MRDDNDELYALISVYKEKDDNTNSLFLKRRNEDGITIVKELKDDAEFLNKYIISMDDIKIVAADKKAIKVKQHRSFIERMIAFIFGILSLICTLFIPKLLLNTIVASYEKLQDGQFGLSCLLTLSVSLELLGFLLGGIICILFFRSATEKDVYL